MPHSEVNRVNKKGKCECKPPVSFIYLTVTILYTFHEARKISYGPSLYTEAFLTSRIQSAKPGERYACGSWTCFSRETQAVDCQLHYYTASLILFVLYGCDWFVSVFFVFLFLQDQLEVCFMFSFTVLNWDDEIYTCRGGCYIWYLTVPQHHAGALGPDCWFWGHLLSCAGVTLSAPPFIIAPGP